MKSSDSNLSKRVLGILDRQEQALESFVVDVIDFLDDKNLLKAFVKKRMERKKPNGT